MSAIPQTARDLRPNSNTASAHSDAVLDFWLGSGPHSWYRSDPAFDAVIRTQFLSTWQAAKAGLLRSWTRTPRMTLALLIVLDQFPRNMFRGMAASFATDAQARAVAKTTIQKGWDTCIPEPERQFIYMPLMHSEFLADQDRMVRLVLMRMPEIQHNILPHARAHRAVIRAFGRFPNRNAALGRRSRVDETSYLELGGYGHTLRRFGIAPS